MARKLKVAVLGTGNIGTDILFKLQRSRYLTCTLFAGHSMRSRGREQAEKLEVPFSDQSIRAIQQNSDCCDIVFDATNAQAHKLHAPILEGLGKFAIDLTPALVGKMCVPVLNLAECLNLPNVNMITCGGQATVPMAAAVSRVHREVEYIEIVAAISSKSAGPGTRQNIDEFTQTTKDALANFSNARKTKAIIILNSAEPPVNMRNTLYALIKQPDMPKIIKSVRAMEARIQQYVPGYRVLYDPVYENGRVTMTIEVIGQGDYLPKYAGNLDIITCAAIEVAEGYAKKLFCREVGTIEKNQIF